MPHEFRIARWMYKLPLRMRSLFRGRDVETELQAEFAYHIERATDENIARGMSPRDARAAAIRSIGGVAQRIEECRDARGIRLLEDFVQDLRYAVRTLLRARGFAAAAVVTLALGVGANTAVFAVVSGVRLRPLPFPEPDRLFLIAHSPRGPFTQRPSLSDRDYLTFRSSDRAFEHAAAFSSFNANLITPSEPSRVSVGRVTAEFFTTLGVAPAMGRTFAVEDEQAADQLIVLGEVLWRARFGGATDILGKRVMVDGRSRTVIGVMPAGFSFPRAQRLGPCTRSVSIRTRAC